MYKPDLKEFLKLSKTANLIPIYKEINADLDTPVSAFLKLRPSDYAFLLESVEGKEKLARYSFLGSDPSLIFKSNSKNIEIIFPHSKKINRFVSDDPFFEIRKILSSFKSADVVGLPRFYGGLVGYIGYDAVRFFEKIPDKNKNTLKAPDILLMLTSTLLIFDHLKHTLKFVNNLNLGEDFKGLSEKKKEDLYFKAIAKIEEMHKDFSSKLILKEISISKKNINIKSNMKKIEFLRMVKTAKEYIKNGDIIQVVLSQIFKVKTKKDPLSIYRSLRNLNPCAYMYFLKLKDFFVIGSSPEMLVRCENGLVQTRPIAGTRPRGKDEVEDSRLACELVNDKKERAEHLMLVDLGRNDLGKVSKMGTVKVSEFMRIEKYSHVMHLVSEVAGMLDNLRFDIYDVLKAAFPAGTVSGAPKIRAMEIIDELESARRGLYAGCIGYFSFSRNMDTCITIRTIVLKDNVAYVQAGAGIVADSVPEKEYQETINKAKALMEAIRS